MPQVTRSSATAARETRRYGRTVTSHKTADTAVPIHPHLAERWSPRGFDVDHTLDDAQLAALLEAARWAPSAGNSQPWRFIVGRRGDRTFHLILKSLAPGNHEWAQYASALMVACAVVVDSDGKEQRWAEYDTGQAVAMLSVQASELGLHVHQMGGFDADAIRAAFDLPADVTPVSAIAIGRWDPGADLPADLAEREQAARGRTPLDTIVIAGSLT